MSTMNRPGSIVGSIIVDPRSLIADRLWLRYADFHIVGDPELQTLSIPSNLSDVMERVQDAMQVPVLALHYDDRNLRRLYEIRSQEDFTRCLVAFEEFFSRELKTHAELATIAARLGARASVDQMLEAVRVLWALCCVPKVHAVVLSTGVLPLMLEAGTAFIGRSDELTTSICAVLGLLVCWPANARALDSMSLMPYLNSVVAAALEVFALTPTATGMDDSESDEDNPASALGTTHDIFDAVATVVAGLTRHARGHYTLAGRGIPLVLQLAVSPSTSAAICGLQSLCAVLQSSLGACRALLRHGGFHLAICGNEQREGADTIAERRLCIATSLGALAVHREGRALLGRTETIECMLCCTRWAMSGGSEYIRQRNLAAKSCALAFWGFSAELFVMSVSPEDLHELEIDTLGVTVIAAIAKAGKKRKVFEFKRPSPVHGVAVRAVAARYAIEVGVSMLELLISNPDRSIASSLLGAVANMSICPNFADSMCSSHVMPTLLSRIRNAKAVGSRSDELGMCMLSWVLFTCSEEARARLWVSGVGAQVLGCVEAAIAQAAADIESTHDEAVSGRAGPVAKRLCTALSTLRYVAGAVTAVTSTAIASAVLLPELRAAAQSLLAVADVYVLAYAASTVWRLATLDDQRSALVAAGALQALLAWHEPLYFATQERGDVERSAPLIVQRRANVFRHARYIGPPIATGGIAHATPARLAHELVAAAVWGLCCDAASVGPFMAAHGIAATLSVLERPSAERAPVQHMLMAALWHVVKHDRTCSLRSALTEPASGAPVLLYACVIARSLAFRTQVIALRLLNDLYGENQGAVVAILERAFGTNAMERLVLSLLLLQEPNAHAQAAAILAVWSGESRAATRIGQCGGVALIAKLICKTLNRVVVGSLLVALLNMSTVRANQPDIGRECCTILFDFVQDEAGIAHRELAAKIVQNISVHPANRTRLYKIELFLRSGAFKTELAGSTLARLDAAAVTQRGRGLASYEDDRRDDKNTTARTYVAPVVTLLPIVDIHVDITSAADAAVAASVAPALVCAITNARPHAITDPRLSDDEQQARFFDTEVEPSPRDVTFDMEREPSPRDVTLPSLPSSCLPSVVAPPAAPSHGAGVASSSKAARRTTANDGQTLTEAVLRERYTSWASLMSPVTDRLSSPSSGGRPAARLPLPTPVLIPAVAERPASSMGIKPSAFSESFMYPSRLALDQPIPATSSVLAGSHASVVSLRRRLCSSFQDICPTVDRPDCAGFSMLDATDFGTTIVPTTPTAAHLQSVLAPLSFKSTTDALLPDRPATVEVIGVPLKNETVPRWRPPIADAVVVGAKKSAAASTSPTARVSPPPRRKPADVTLPLQDVPKSLAKQLEEKVALARVMYRNQLEGTERDGEPANAWKDHESLPFTMTVEPSTNRHKFFFQCGSGGGRHDFSATSGLTMFSHAEGSTVCKDLYPHVRLPDGSLKHFYYEDKVHEAVFEAIEDLPPVPLHLTDIFQVEFPLPVAVAAPTSADLSNPYRPCKPGVALPPAHLCTRTPECPYFGCRYKNLIRFAVTPKAPVEEQAVRARATSVVQIKVWDMSDTVFRPRLQESDSRSYLNTNRMLVAACENDWVAISKKKRFRTHIATVQTDPATAGSEIDEVKKILGGHYRLICGVYDFFASSMAGADEFTMQLTEFLDFANNAELRIANLDIIFISANVEENKGSLEDALKSTKAFTRFEFVESLIRIAIAKYMKADSEPTTLPAALRRLFKEHVIPNVPHQMLPGDGFRRERLYVLDVNEVLKIFLPDLRYIYSTICKPKDWGKIRVSARSATLLGPEEWIVFIRDMGLFDDEYTNRKAMLCFMASRMWVISEVRGYEKNRLLSFTDFVEALCRMADLKSFPTEENAKEAGFSTVVDYMTATPAEHVLRTYRRDSADITAEKTQPLASKVFDMMSLMLGRFNSMGKRAGTTPYRTNLGRGRLATKPPITAIRTMPLPA